LDTRSHGLFLE